MADKLLRDIDKQNNELLLNRLYLALFCITLLVVVCIRLRLLALPFERDEGEFAYIAQLLLQGKMPYLHAYSMKLPGMYAIYALFMLVFGQSIAGVHFGFLLVNVSSAFLVYAITGKLIGNRGSAVAGATFAILSISRTVLGTFAHATNFLVFFVLLGLFLQLRARESGKTRTWFISGLCYGLAVTMKQHGLFFCLIPVVTLFVPMDRQIPLRETGKKLLYLFAGMALPFLLILVTMLITSAFDKFWFWTFQYARAYASNISIDNAWPIFKNQFGDVTRATGFFWLITAAGLLGLLAGRFAKKDKLLVLLLVMSSIASICPGFYFRPHYFVMMLPVIAILNGTAVVWLSGLVPARISSAINILLLASFATATGYILFSERKTLLFASPVEAVKLAYQTQKPFAESVAVAEYIKANTTRQDRIYVVGSEPQIYFYAARQAATGYIYMYYIGENHRYALEMQKELVDEISFNQPKYVVVVNDMSSWLVEQSGNTDYFNSFIESWMKSNYVVDAVMPVSRNSSTTLITGAQAKQSIPAGSHMLILKRRF